jgi:hypothetical protein
MHHQVPVRVLHRRSLPQQEPDPLLHRQRPFIAVPLDRLPVDVFHAERVLRREAIRITEFSADPELGVLFLDRD